MTATTERPESWRAAITSALGLPVDEPLANVLRALARLQVRADQVPTLEADLAKAHERADKAETELAGRSPPAPMEALPDQQAWFVVHQRDGTPMVDPFIGEGAEHAAKLTARSYAARWTDVYVMVGCPVSSADFEAEAMAERARTAAVELHREPRWLATMRERLGAEPDEDVAFDAGRYVQAADVRRERERLGIPEYVAPAPAPDPMAIYKPWRGAADELAVQLSALNEDELEQVRVAFNVTRGARLIERLTNRIRRGA